MRVRVSVRVRTRGSETWSGLGSEVWAGLGEGRGEVMGGVGVRAARPGPGWVCVRFRVSCQGQGQAKVRAGSVVRGRVRARGSETCRGQG